MFFCRLGCMCLVEALCCHQQPLCLVFQLRLQDARKSFWPRLQNRMDLSPLRFFTLQRKLEFLKYYLQVNWRCVPQFQKISIQYIQHTDITEKNAVQTFKIVYWKSYICTYSFTMVIWLRIKLFSMYQLWYEKKLGESFVFLEEMFCILHT